MKEIEYWLWLSKLNGLSNLQKNRILSYFSDPRSAFLADEIEFREAAGFRNKKQLEGFKKTISLEAVEKDIRRMETEKIEYISIEDCRYPLDLKEIYNPPIGLYVKGDASLLKAKPAIAIVGSRNASVAAIQYAKEFSKIISSMGLAIISGLAEGVDSSAHWGAIDEPGKTITVLGNGIDICYPNFNEKLYLKIAQQGLLVSEFNLGEKPLAFHFPLRNRIISGLSDGILVVEAGQKSGSMITVNHALDQGKNVYVIPGEINNPRWSGGNVLLKEGAKLVTEPKDILEDFIQKRCEQKILKNDRTIDPEFRVIADLISKGFTTVDDLMRASGLSVSELNYSLTMMELDEIITVRRGKITFNR